MTVTAPIRLPARTAAALGDKVRRDLARRPAGLDGNDTIHGNRIRVRLVKGGPARPSDVIGFVDNPDTDPAVLMDIAQALIAGIGARPRSAPPAAGDRWLVLAVAGELPGVEPYRHAYAQLSLAADFKKALLVLADGRIETLGG